MTSVYVALFRRKKKQGAFLVLTARRTMQTFGVKRRFVLRVLRRRNAPELGKVPWAPRRRLRRKRRKQQLPRKQQLHGHVPLLLRRSQKQRQPALVLRSNQKLRDVEKNLPLPLNNYALLRSVLVALCELIGDFQMWWKVFLCYRSRT